MDQVAEEAILGTLTSPNYTVQKQVIWNVANKLSIPLRCWVVSSQGILQDTGLLIAPKSATQISDHYYPDTAYYVWREAMSGAFAFVTYTNYSSAAVDNVWEVDLTQDMLLQPGDIGPLPGTTAAPLPGSVILPQDSARVVVGCGDTTGGYLVRYQFWHITDDSYCLPPGDKRTVTLTTTTGMTDTTTDQTTVSQSLSTSASAGWGPVSSTISASLSTSSSTMHSYTVNEQTTRFESIELNNFDTTGPVTYMAWQMMDVVDIFSDANNVYVPMSSVYCARLPKLYVKLAVPDYVTVARPVLTEAEKQSARGWQATARPAGLR